MFGLYLILTFILGSIIGSFVSALTYRLPRNINFGKSRSFCDYCKVKISWYDNIPILSFILLRGRCRKCKNKIAKRYPIIEIATAFLFSFLGVLLLRCWTNQLFLRPDPGLMCSLKDLYGYWTFPYLAFLVTSLLSIFIIDLEQKIIPDRLTFICFSLTLILFILFSYDSLYKNLAVAFGASLFFLLVHLITKGKGMGLGDVKLALFAGLFFGWPQSLTWFYISIVSGAIIGTLLIVFKKAKFGRQIPFGPFMVFSFLITLIWGELLTRIMFFFIK